MHMMHKSSYNRYVDWRQMPEGDREEKLLIAPTASVLNVLFSVVLDLLCTAQLREWHAWLGCVEIE